MPALQEDGKDFLYWGYPMHLTFTELRIMRALTEYRSCEVSALGAGSAATVSVHVCAINKKAHAIGGRRLICKVKGGSYRLCDDI